MSGESWTIISCTIALAAAFLGVHFAYLVPTLQDIRRHAQDIQGELMQLRERVTRLETQLEFCGSTPTPESWIPGIPDEPPTRKIGFTPEEE